MATVVSDRHAANSKHTISFVIPGTKTAYWALPVGRIFFSLIFIVSSYNHFTGQMIGYAESHGVPFASILVPLSGVLSLIGGLSVFLGWKARFGAILLMFFLVPVTLIMHNFWSITDPQEAQTQVVNFMKNLSMLGGAMFIASVGPGPYSADGRK